jgi:hypothetical protein
MDGAIFAVFRCSFGDCTTRTGASLWSAMIEESGPIVGILSALFIFFVTIGLFNVISAIFVEATLSARMRNQDEKKTARLNDTSLFARNMKIVIKNIVKTDDADDQPPHHDFDLQHIDEWSKIEVTTAHFKTACTTDEEVKQALRELDIHEGDFPSLADILDPQNDRKVDLFDILEGITRLRGDPRRSDIVNVDLMIRDVQESIIKLRIKLDMALADA